jgi:hypothetical protein
MSNKVASSGKTGLTKPLAAVFGDAHMPVPQTCTSFGLLPLIDKKAIIWNDFRWPHPALGWGDLLNLLDNEPFMASWFSLIWLNYLLFCLDGWVVIVVASDHDLIVCNAC